MIFFKKGLSAVRSFLQKALSEAGSTMAVLDCQGSPSVKRYPHGQNQRAKPSQTQPGRLEPLPANQDDTLGASQSLGYILIG
jgi:hypothetical protein